MKFLENNTFTISAYALIVSLESYFISFIIIFKKYSSVTISSTASIIQFSITHISIALPV